MNYNKIVLVGRVTQDPEIRALPSGSSVASFGLATNRYWKDKEGNRQEETQFHNIVLFAGLADIAQQYIQKGSEVLIEGRVQYRSWEAQDGTKRYRTEIVGENMQLGSRPGAGSGSSGGSDKSNAGAAKSKSEEVPIVSQDDSTPSSDASRSKKGNKKQAAQGAQAAIDEEEINIEEDIPF